MQVDLHGYHPSEIVNNGVLDQLVQQAWEMGEAELTVIHGQDSYRTYPRESLIELLTRRLPIAQKVLADAIRQLEERGFASIAHVRLTDEERLDIGFTGLGDKFRP